jgi:hypothetical protein
MIPLYKLQKKGGGRIKMMETYSTICLENSDKTPSNWIVPVKSLKTMQDESYDEFVHVMTAMIKDDIPIIVKIQEDSRMLRTELQIMKILKQHSVPNTAYYICYFSCSDTFTRLSKPINGSDRLCIGGTDVIHIILMEYVTEDITSILDKCNFNQLVSILQQSMFFIGTIGLNHNITHGDLHSGNVLIRPCKLDKIVTYKILDQTINVNTYGYEVVFIDFQRSRIVKGDENMLEAVLDSTSLLTDILANYVDQNYKTKLKNLAMYQIEEWNESHKIFIEKVVNLGKYLSM